MPIVILAEYSRERKATSSKELRPGIAAAKVTIQSDILGRTRIGTSAYAYMGASWDCGRHEHVPTEVLVAVLRFPRSGSLRPVWCGAVLPLERAVPVGLEPEYDAGSATGKLRNVDSAIECAGEKVCRAPRTLQIRSAGSARACPRDSYGERVVGARSAFRPGYAAFGLDASTLRRTLLCL
jgi:hypothetical protein